MTKKEKLQILLQLVKSNNCHGVSCDECRIAREAKECVGYGGGNFRKTIVRIVLELSIRES